MLFTPKLKKIRSFFIQVPLNTILWGTYDALHHVKHAKCREEFKKQYKAIEVMFVR
jgi:hypothetical protein